MPSRKSFPIFRALLSLFLLALFCLPATAGGGPTIVTGVQTVAGTFGTGTTVTYTVVLTCNGGGQTDNNGPEFVEDLPAGLTLVDASANNGITTAEVGLNRVSWNGSFLVGGSVTITIHATINAAAGATISAQGTIAYDADRNGSNESTGMTDDSGTPGVNPTTFTVLQATLSATQTAAGTFKAGGSVTYTVVITNGGTGAQMDNVGDEFFETVPAQFDFTNVIASSGITSTTVNSDDDSTTVYWNGSIPAGGTVTITISATVRASAGGQIATVQGIINCDTNLDGTNESTTYTDDPGTAAAQDANTVTIASALVSAAQTVAGLFVPGGIATYTVTLTNSGSAAQPDNAGNEFAETLPSSLVLVDASASAGTTVATAGTGVVTWNGAIPAGGSVTITIHARVAVAAVAGDMVSVQGEVDYDFDLDGTNEQAAQTFQPPLGEDATPTKFTVRDFNDPAFVIGSKITKFAVLANDLSSGITPTLQITGTTNGLYGTVTKNADGSLNYTPTGKIPAGGHDAFTYTVDAGAAGTYIATVTVRDLTYAAATYNGLLEADGTGKTARNSGLLRVTVSKAGTLTGSLTVGGKKYALVAKLDAFGVARFGPKATADLVLKRTVPRGQPALPEWRVALRLPDADALDTVTATMTEAQDPYTVATADRAYFTSKKNPVPPLINLPAGLAGKYTVAFGPHGAPNQGLDATQFPQGSGFGLLTVATSGVATVKGTLADGTPVTYSNALALNRQWPLYVALYKGKGALTGMAQFLPSAMSDVTATDLLWFNPGSAKAPRYPNGWSGIFVGLTGSLFSLPPKGTVASVLPGLGATDPAGNAKFTATGGNLTTDPLIVPVNVDTKNKVQFIMPPAGLLPKLTIAPTGLVTGSMVHPDTHKVVTFKGIVLQKLKRIDGYFSGLTEVGSLRLAPN